LQKFRAEMPSEPVGFRGLVDASRTADEKATAEATLEAAAARFPDDFWVRREYALSALVSGSREVAIKRSKELLDKFPDRPDAYQFVLTAFRRAGWSMEAEAVDVEMRRRNHRPSPQK
jgi:predicted Zn-dependent protease